MKKEEIGFEKEPVPGWRKRLQVRFPEQAFEGDEDYDRVLEQFIDGVEADERSFKEANDQMIALLKMNPELASVMDDMLRNKVPFRVALAGHYGPEELVPQDGDDDYDAWQGKYEERKRRLADDDRMLEELGVNETASMKVIDGFCREKEMTEEEREEFLNACDEEIADVVRKKVSRKFLETMWNGLHAERIAGDAAREAEIKTRNEKIEAKRAEERRRNYGDGVPSPVQTGGGQSERKEEGFLDDVIGRRSFI